MRTITLAIICLLMALGAAAQMPAAQTKAAEKQPAPCAVSGQVVTAAEGAPLKSSRIALIQQDVSSHSQVFATTTGSDGRFEIKQAAPGRYRFWASHTGYIGQQYRAKGVNQGAVLTLAPGQEVNNVLFRLVRAAVVSGRIVDESGEPMAKLAVTALRKPSAEEKEDWGPAAKKLQFIGSTAAMTDDRGEYRIFGLKPGEYYLKAADSDLFESFGIDDQDDGTNWNVRKNLGSPYAAVFYPGVIQLDQAQPLQLGPGEEVEADFTMRTVKTVEVAGRVVAPDGRPATHASVALSVPEIADRGDELGASAGAKGEFSIKGVPPGSYVLEAQQRDENGFHRAQQKLEVGNDNLDSIVIAFGKGTTIPGRIVAASPGVIALDHIQIGLESASESDTGIFAVAKVKQDGSFQITDVSDGNYALQVSGKQDWHVKSARLEGQDVLQKGLEVEQGSTSGTLEIVLSSASAQLEGTVIGQEKPVPGAQVLARPDPETFFNRTRSESATTDQNGHFTFSALAPGKYRITAKLPSVSSEAPAITSEPKAVTLGEHDHQAVELTLAAPRSE